MNEKITLPTLTQLLALRTGDTKRQSEDFIKEFVGLVSEILAAGEAVKIKNFGVFKTITVEARKSVNVSTGEDHQIPAHRKVSFVAAKEVAAVVNEPFDMFETVELRDNYIDDDLKEEDDSDDENMDDLIDETSDDTETSAETDPEDSEISIALSGSTCELESDSVSGVCEEDDEPIYSVEDNSDSELEESIEKPHDFSAVDDSSGIKTSVTATDTDPRGGQCPPMHEVASDCIRTAADNVHVNNENIVDDGNTCIDEESIDEEVMPADCNATQNIRQKGKRTKLKDKFFTGYISGMLTAVIILGIIYVGYRYIDWNDWQIISRDGNAVTSQVAVNSIEADKSATLPEVKEDDSVASESEASAKTSEDANEMSDESDKIEEAPTAPSDSKVYDTISKTRYLTTMAKDHYGNFNLWPYIYIENKSFLGHPDRIKPGTRVVIPPLSKYGVDPKNSNDISKAKKMGVEIYSRYKK